MTLRFYTFLFSVTLLVLLSACATTGTTPVDKPTVEPDRPSKPETSESKGFDLQYQLQRDPSARSLAEVIELSRQMSAGYQPEVALEILRSLEYVPSGQLRAMLDTPAYDPEFTAWLDLALQTRKLLINRGPIPAAAQEWADDHDGHVITRENFSDLMTRYRKLFPVPAQVAVLLPTEGGLAAAANAIRDGILSAYLEQPGQSVLRFYSSGDSSESTIAAYLQAREDGATQIVGPLRTESASALASLDNPGVPILLLNEPVEYKPVDPLRKTSVNSLSLSQTEEAMAIAKHALALGQKRAILIVQDSTWGMNSETTFATQFEQGEGRISATVSFNSTSEDNSAMLTRLLKIDESEQRKTDLQSRLGIALNFEPSRRDDFDFIFMAASPKEGRELKPLLRFHDAGDVPVYAMGRIFNGKAEPATDQDLNGIVFPITSWQLQTAGAESLALESLRDGAYGHLYALGLDAWQVLPWLPLMQEDPDLWYSGEVGELRMQANGHLERQPAWAQFSAGQTIPYPWPDVH